MNLCDFANIYALFSCAHLVLLRRVEGILGDLFLVASYIDAFCFMSFLHLLLSFFVFVGIGHWSSASLKSFPIFTFLVWNSFIMEKYFTKREKLIFPSVIQVKFVGMVVAWLASIMQSWICMLIALYVVTSVASWMMWKWWPLPLPSVLSPRFIPYNPALLTKVVKCALALFHSRDNHAWERRIWFLWSFSVFQCVSWVLVR